jgi:glycerophosphoryl diester phosphodiesterase
MRRAWRIALGLALVLAAFVYLNNTNLLRAPAAGRPVLLAHRGLHQTFPADGLKADTCTATRIHPPEHGYLENTLPAMAAAFAAGADIVELDVHPTTDGHLAVLHDWTLDCRTDGKGPTRAHTLAELKALDVGYGYTADGGRTYPFRGKGVGLLPSLDEVLAAFPDRRLLIDIKSNDPADGERLARRLEELPPAQTALIMVYGGDRPVAAVHARLPGLMTLSRAGLQSCLLRYIAIGWTGYVPAACRGGLLLIPINVAPWLWGWPGRFVERFKAAGAEVLVAGPWAGGFSSGIDDAATLARLPAGYAGGIWTNRIDRIAPLVRLGP